VKAFETRLAARSWTLTTHTEERGHAGFAHVLLAMATALERREIDAAIVGGLDSYYDPEAMQELIDARRLFDGEQLDSMIPGEGGALLLIARRDTVHQLRGKPVAEIRAVAVGVEPALPDNEIPSTAVGLTGAVLACGSWLKRRNKPLGWWLSDMTGEEFRVQELQLVWPRVSGDLDLRGVHLDFLGSHLGDLGAATLPTALAIAIEGLNRGAPAAQHALCTASSVTSERGCVLLEAVGSGGA
jgi:3-oxoacyl-[acyl-carrier-protein] synthase-1